MPGDYFWQCVDSLATAFDGDRHESEASLDIYREHCLGFTSEKRANVRRQLVKIIGGLARLETQLADQDTA